MVFYRCFVLSLVLGFVFASPLFAVLEKEKDGEKAFSTPQKRKSSNNTSNPAKKIKKKVTRKTNKEDLNSKTDHDESTLDSTEEGFKTPQKTPIKSSLADPSPLKTYLAGVRNGLVRAKHQYGKLSSPVVRDIFRENDPGNFFTRKVYMNGEYVLQADHLFFPTALVLSKSGQWETNLQRMKRGCSPIAHKGIVTQWQREKKNLTKDQILALQSPFLIELHHVTQKDSGTEEDPICEITRRAHMGRDGRLIVEVDEETQLLKIVHECLSREEALLLCEENQVIEKNILHFRKGGSLIPRDEFAKWRTLYWQMRAENIEQGQFEPIKSLMDPHTPIFGNVVRTLFQT